MRTRFKIAVLSAIVSVSTMGLAAPGEFWEITSKMEMPGMPMAMPANTVKVCIPKGAERDPKYTADKSCVVSDVKTSGNKTSWSMRCDQDGQVMTGTGEMSGTADNAQGKVHMKGTGKESFEMDMTYHNKRLGGACDSEEQVKKLTAQMCDPGTSDVAQRVYAANMLMNEKACPGKKQPFCESVRTEAPRDARVFGAIIDADKNAKVQVAKGCGIDMVATNKALCKTLDKNNIGELARFCPAEAKLVREVERRKACEGRSFTAKEDLSKCLAGKSGGSGNVAARTENAATAKGKDSASGDVSVADQATEQPASPQPNAGEALMDGAKKLKGLFGF